MRIFFVPVMLLFVPTFLTAQTSAPIITKKPLVPKITTIFHKLGDDFIKIRTYQYGEEKEPFFVSLHDDEVTAVDGAKRMLESGGGVMVKIDNKKQRNIRFKMKGKYYTCDPNRIFSRVGIIQTLSMFGRVNPTAVDEVDKLANRILQLLPDTTNCIVSLHNNSNGRYSVTSYLPGNEREKDAKAVHTVRSQDPDDIFLTTDSLLYRQLVKENYNTILQDNINVKKDGSLSVYCGEKAIPYLNCETEHGKLKQYSEMITVAMSHILKQGETIQNETISFESKEPDSKSIVYTYQLLPLPNGIAHKNISEGEEIYFGDRKIGSVKHADNENSTGKIEIKKDFPLYNNMDFYIFSLINNTRKIELRIDPTRPKELYDPETATILMKVVP